MASVDTSRRRPRVIWRGPGGRQLTRPFPTLEAAIAFKRELEDLAKVGQTIEQAEVSRVGKRPIEFGIACYLRSLGAAETPETAWVTVRKHLSPTRLRDRQNRLVAFAEMRPRLTIISDLGEPRIRLRLEDYLLTLKAKQAERTNAVRAIIVGLGEYCRRQGWIATNPADLADRGDQQQDTRVVVHRAFEPHEAEALAGVDDSYTFRLWSMLRTETVCKITRGHLRPWQGGYLLRLTAGMVKQLPPGAEVEIALAPRLTEMLRARLEVLGLDSALLFDMPRTPGKRERKLWHDLAAAGIDVRTDAGMINARSFRLTSHSWAVGAGVHEDLRHLMRLDLGKGPDRLTRFTYVDWEQLRPRFVQAWQDVDRWYRDQVVQPGAKDVGPVGRIGAAAAS